MSIVRTIHKSSQELHEYILLTSKTDDVLAGIDSCAWFMIGSALVIFPKYEESGMFWKLETLNRLMKAIENTTNRFYGARETGLHWR